MDSLRDNIVGIMIGVHLGENPTQRILGWLIERLGRPQAFGTNPGRVATRHDRERVNDCYLETAAGVLSRVLRFMQNTFIPAPHWHNDYGCVESPSSVG